MKESFFLLFRTGFKPTNGTSVQLSGLLSGRENQVVHLQWDPSEAGSDSVPHCVIVDDSEAWNWPLPRGGRVYLRTAWFFQLRWWLNEKVNGHRLQRALRRIPLRPAAAYVVCMHEADARKISSLLEVVGTRDYVLHIMDIFHLRLSESETPAFIRLIQGARHVICISGLIEKEAKANGARSSSLLNFGATLPIGNHAPFQFPLRIIISGSLWLGHYPENRALQCLEAAWPLLQDRFPEIELHYTGTNYQGLPFYLRTVAKEHGLLSQKAYHQLLRTMHIGYLPVSHPSDSVGRYSVPSRMADYFALGLPVITCTDEETSIASFIRHAPAQCAVNISDEASLVGAVVHLASTPEAWERASKYAMQFAEERLRMEHIRTELFGILGKVARKEEPRSRKAEWETAAT
jgi:hypothetical protein